MYMQCHLLLKKKLHAAILDAPRTLATSQPPAASVHPTPNRCKHILRRQCLNPSQLRSHTSLDPKHMTPKTARLRLPMNAHSDKLTSGEIHLLPIQCKSYLLTSCTMLGVPIPLAQKALLWRCLIDAIDEGSPGRFTSIWSGCTAAACTASCTATAGPQALRPHVLVPRHVKPLVCCFHALVRSGHVGIVLVTQAPSLHVGFLREPTGQDYMKGKEGL